MPEKLTRSDAEKLLYDALVDEAQRMRRECLGKGDEDAAGKWYWVLTQLEASPVDLTYLLSKMLCWYQHSPGAFLRALTGAWVKIPPPPKYTEFELLLNTYREKAWESGYYAAVIEKSCGTLDEEERAKYDALLIQARDEREDVRAMLMEYEKEVLK